MFLLHKHLYEIRTADWVTSNETREIYDSCNGDKNKSTFEIPQKKIL